MQIASANIWMSSTRSYLSNRRVEERLRAWNGESRPDFESKGERENIVRRDLVELSDQARAAVAELNQSSGVTTLPESSSLLREDSAEILMIEKLLEQVTGKKIKIKILRFDDSATGGQVQERAEKLQRAGELQGAGNENIRAGWGVEYDYTEQFEEAERTTFSATGIVQTRDGKEIEIALDITMSREFTSYTEVHAQFGDAVRKDPLVINLKGNAARLSTEKFSFDLDLDGAPDQISRPGADAGFLIIDKNGDGIVNDGRELFGPTTGDGFSELAAYDTDNNRWIDEGDPAFNRLRIWTQDAKGDDQLVTLGQAGVGAISLDRMATPFSINDTANRSLGIVQSTGIWLGENGNAGTVQHIDLVV